MAGKRQASLEARKRRKVTLTRSRTLCPEGGGRGKKTSLHVQVNLPYQRKEAILREQVGIRSPSRYERPGCYIPNPKKSGPFPFLAERKNIAKEAKRKGP